MTGRDSTQTDQARARWAAEYREARKVRRFWDAFPELPSTLSLASLVDYGALSAAGRVDGEVCNLDTLKFSKHSRLLWQRAGCRMPVTGPYEGALPA